MGDNGGRRGMYQLPSIKTLTGSPPRQPPTKSLLSSDGRQQLHSSQPLPPPPPPPPLSYDQQRDVGQQLPPSAPLFHGHYSQPLPLQPPPPPLPPARPPASSRLAAPPSLMSSDSHVSAMSPPLPSQRQEYSSSHSHAQYSHPHMLPSLRQQNYTYAHAVAQPHRHGEQHVATGPPPHAYRHQSSGRLESSYAGHAQSYAGASAPQLSPVASPMDMAGMVFTHPHSHNPSQSSPLEHVHNLGSQAIHHSHLLALPPQPPAAPLPQPAASQQPAPVPLSALPPYQSPPPPLLLSRQLQQQTIHAQPPHYSHTQHGYSTYGATSFSQSPGAIPYDASSGLSTRSLVPADTHAGSSAMGIQSAPRQLSAGNLAPAPTGTSRLAFQTKPVPVAAKAPIAATTPAAPPAPVVSGLMGLNKESAATSNLDDFEDGDDDDDDNDIDGDPENGESEALLKRRKRNAQSAARLRERRKTREHELTSSCTKLESQIARLEGELSDEKHRAMLDLQSNKSLAAISNIVEVGSSADVAGAPIEEPNSAGPQSQGTKRQWMLVAPNTDREGDYTMGSPEGETAMNESAAERPRNPRKKSKPLRELDQDRLDDLRSKIETLGKLNQQVCVNLGMLRQEIKRISNAITLKRPVASACG